MVPTHNRDQIRGFHPTATWLVSWLKIGRPSEDTPTTGSSAVLEDGLDAVDDEMWVLITRHKWADEIWRRMSST